MEAGYIAVFLLGLLGGTHCVGMCGGIVATLTAKPVMAAVVLPRGSSVISLPAGLTNSPFWRDWAVLLAYNFGRITSYGLAGAVMGALGSAGLLFEGLLPVQVALYVVANLMLIGLGLYLCGQTSVLLPLERLGQGFWRRIQPYTRSFLPAHSWRQALPLGAIWGFLPCGMVYSVLTTALVTGSATRGAGLMLAFGLGTLPNLLLAGVLLKRLRTVTQRRWVRLTSGGLILGFGVLGLLRAPDLGGKLWQGIVCHF